MRRSLQVEPLVLHGPHVAVPLAVLFRTRGASLQTALVCCALVSSFAVEGLAALAGISPEWEISCASIRKARFASATRGRKRLEGVFTGAAGSIAAVAVKGKGCLASGISRKTIRIQCEMLACGLNAFLPIAVAIQGFFPILFVYTSYFVSFTCVSFKMIVA